MVGIANRDIDFYMHPSDGLLFWGYICCAAKKIGFGEESSKYGEISVKGDKIGVLLEYEKSEAKLTFYRNRVKRVYIKNR
jgi:hypothetical protein